MQDSETKEIKNQKTIYSQQKESQLSKARAHLKRMQDFDSHNTFINWCHTNRAQETRNKKILLYAQQCKENGMDLSKRMDQLLKYAKIVTVRDEQKIENKKLKSEIKKKEEKLDLIMELERLKGIKLEEEQKYKRRLKKIEEAKILLEQMAQKKIRKEKERQDIIKEGEEIKKHIIEQEEAEKVIEQKKIIEKKKLAEEIVETNKIFALRKEQQLKQEKEQDLKILKYNMEKSKKEEEELKQKKIDRNPERNRDTKIARKTRKNF